MRTANNQMDEILEWCERLDARALVIYNDLTERDRGSSRETLWMTMADEEREHQGYWRRLRKMSSEGMFPNVFDQPFQVLEDLKEIGRQMDQVKDGLNGTDSFVIALRSEFHMLNQAFSQLFHFIKNLDGHDPADEYEEHLSRLIRAMRAEGGLSPELELLAETVERLWKDNQALAVQSNTDPLTGLLNRRGLNQAIIPLSYLSQRSRSPSGILMIDIDDFKLVNDRHGHHAGDEALFRIAQVIKGSIRASDVVGRVGGEEFLVYLPMTGGDELAEVAEKIRAAVAGETRASQPVTVSLGGAVATFTREIEAELESFIGVADAALYEAKAAGKNSYREGKRPALPVDK